MIINMLMAIINTHSPKCIKEKDSVLARLCVCVYSVHAAEIWDRR